MSGSVMENPAEIISHILSNDLNFTFGVNQEKYDIASTQHNSWRFGFTVSEKINSKELIEDIAKSSKLFPKIRPNDGRLSFVTLKDIYMPEDVDVSLDALDIINYQFKQTSLSDVKTKVRVKYALDPELDEYDRVTEYIYANELLPSYSESFYGLDIDSEDSILEFESDYIRDMETANLLRDWLCLQNCNQKMILSLELLPSFSFLETGDVIHIKEVINDVKSYNNLYNLYSEINGQIVFPFFMISDVSVSSKSVKIKAMQLHNLSTLEGSQSLESFLQTILGLSLEEIDEYLTDMDVEPDIQSSGVRGCTYSDAENYDESATIDDGSCEFVLDDGSGLDILPGDINNDGELTVQDLVLIVNEILYGDSVATSSSNSENRLKDMHNRMLQSYDKKDSLIYKILKDEAQATHMSVVIDRNSIEIEANGHIAGMIIEYSGDARFLSKLPPSYHFEISKNKIIVLCFGTKNIPKKMFSFSGTINIKKIMAYTVDKKEIPFKLTHTKDEIFSESKIKFATSETIVWNELVIPKTTGRPFMNETKSRDSDLYKFVKRAEYKRKHVDKKGKKIKTFKYTKE